MPFRHALTVPAIMVATAFATMSATSGIPGRAAEKTFQPTVKADTPAEFPTYTPVGEVRIKKYPAYRKAEADASGSRAFWTLLSHIKRNGIAMTAPVELTYADRQASQEKTMALLYGKADTGHAGAQGNVQVQNVPAMSVVSTGVRGVRTAASVAQARERLNAWLETNRDRYSTAGPMRVMAYNSPFIQQDENYFEVEIPVKESEKVRLRN